MATYVGFSDLVKDHWKVSRGTILLLTRQGKLKKGYHLARFGKKYYFNVELVLHGLNNGFDSKEHLERLKEFSIGGIAQK